VVVDEAKGVCTEDTVDIIVVAFTVDNGTVVALDNVEVELAVVSGVVWTSLVLSGVVAAVTFSVV